MEDQTVPNLSDAKSNIVPEPVLEPTPKGLPSLLKFGYVYFISFCVIVDVLALLALYHDYAMYQKNDQMAQEIRHKPCDERFSPSHGPGKVNAGRTVSIDFFEDIACFRGDQEFNSIYEFEWSGEGVEFSDVISPSGGIIETPFKSRSEELRCELRGSGSQSLSVNIFRNGQLIKTQLIEFDVVGVQSNMVSSCFVSDY